jgi:hypothetical protein
LVEKIGEHTVWLNSDSWGIRKDGYSSGSINPELLESLAEDKLGSFYGPVLLEEEVSALSQPE